jgi:hypothetical protein
MHQILETWEGFDQRLRRGMSKAHSFIEVRKCCQPSPGNLSRLGTGSASASKPLHQLTLSAIVSAKSKWIRSRIVN